MVKGVQAATDNTKFKSSYLHHSASVLNKSTS